MMFKFVLLLMSPEPVPPCRQVVSFFQRWVLSVLLLALTPWPLTLPKYRKRLTVFWVGSSVLLAIFPLSPVITHQANYTLV